MERISKKVIMNIEKTIVHFPAERGGILGRKNDIVCDYFFDTKALSTCDSNTYTPNIESLNCVISDWEIQGITFTGFVHSHQERKLLSPTDIDYAVKVLEIFIELPYLLMGIVGGINAFPLMFFRVYRTGCVYPVVFREV